jgi:accessory gene regulator B
MCNIESFSNMIAVKILKKLSIEDQDKEEVLAYGAFVLIQTILSIMMVSIFGVIFKVLLEALVISLVASFLRKSSGGAHASTPMNCALISVIIFGGLALIVKYYIMNMAFLYLVIGVIIAFIFTCYIMYKYSPVETENKPLRNENTRKRLKKLSIKNVIILFAINSILIFIYLQTQQITLITIAICIVVGVVWQSLSMLSLGHKIINGLDRILRNISNLVRRVNH